MEATKNNRGTNDFFSLKSKVQGLMDKKEEEKADFTDFSQVERHHIIAYVFKARSENGVSKVVATSTTSTDYLESLPPGEIIRLLADPPCMKGEGRVAKGLAGTPALALLPPQPRPLLMPPVIFQTGFQDLKVDLKLWGLQVIEDPPWLAAAVVLGSGTASQLVDYFLLFKWSARMGGWALGQVSAVAEESEKVDGEKCNFSVYYAADDATAQHRLSMAEYAKNTKSPSQSWVLLGKMIDP